MKYKILFNYGSDGHSFQDEEFDSVAKAVKYAIELNYATPFLIVQILDWEAIAKCPYDDCWKVKYNECPTHSKSK